jgi:hypothetical protein
VSEKEFQEGSGRVGTEYPLAEVRFQVYTSSSFGNEEMMAPYNKMEFVYIAFV